MVCSLRGRAPSRAPATDRTSCRGDAAARTRRPAQGATIDSVWNLTHQRVGRVLEADLVSGVHLVLLMPEARRAEALPNSRGRARPACTAVLGGPPENLSFRGKTRRRWRDRGGCASAASEALHLSVRGADEQGRALTGI